MTITLSKLAVTVALAQSEPLNQSPQQNNVMARQRQVVFTIIHKLYNNFKPSRYNE